MTSEPLSGPSEADPAAVFATALSLWKAVHEHRSRNPDFNISEAYNGGDEFMRVVMRIGQKFEEWACVHVVFEATEEVWPYDLEDRFGAACLAMMGAEALASFEEADCLRVAWRLGLPLRADGKLPVPVCVSAQNPVVGSGFRAFRIHTFRRPIDDDDSAEAFTTSDEVCDDEFGPPGFGLYGVEASGLLEHIADRATCLEAVALARKLAPGLELPDCPIVRRS
jgi:hypothetical protein